jgi:hypothetical protein
MTTPEIKAAKRASDILATQLGNVIDAGPRGLQMALHLIASAAAAVIDRAEDRPAAWAYLRRALETSEAMGNAVSEKLDAGEISAAEITALTQTKGNG